MYKESIGKSLRGRSPMMLEDDGKRYPDPNPGGTGCCTKPWEWSEKDQMFYCHGDLYDPCDKPNPNPNPSGEIYDIVKNPRLTYDYRQKMKKGERQKRMTKLRNNYLKFLLDPFNAAPCRVPVEIPYQSHVIQDRANFQLTIGAQANLQGYFAPGYSLRAAAATTSPIGDWHFASQITTITALAGSSWNTVYNALAANMINNTGHQFNYTSNFRSVRLISAGLKIRYIGRLDATSGYLQMGASIENTLINSQILLTPDKINELLYAKKFKISESPQIIWFPLDENDKAWVNLSGSATTGNTETLYAFLMYHIYGAGLPTGLVLDVEVIRNYECVPTNQNLELFGMLGKPVASPVQLYDASLTHGLTNEKSWYSDIFDHAMHFIAENAAEYAISALEGVSWSEVIETGLILLGLI